jgi:ARG and Rhodanese-Phosphatase-superfamily-associated Protein domain
MLNQKTSKGAGAMTELIKNYIEKIQIGKGQSYKNLTLYPLLSDEVIPFDYLTLDEGLSKNLIEVVEVDQHGSVPELCGLIRKYGDILLPF